MKNILSALSLLVFLSCQEQYGNPAAPGFDHNGSDLRAIELADDVMAAMGGRKSYDDVKIISWKFFDFRHLIWDRSTGDVRIDSPRDSTTYLINVETEEGRVKVGSVELQGDSLSMMLAKGKGTWINDSYWLLMPFKLKDSGVTLKYVGEDTTKTGVLSDVVQLTFNDVGLTPQNKYEIWIDKTDKLVKQWAYYNKADAAEPNSIWPWDNYQPLGDLLISYNRSDNRGPKDVAFHEQMDSTVFNSWELPDFVRF